MPQTQGQAPFVCPTCHRESHHPRDISEGFCVVCGFAADNSIVKALEARNHARAAAERSMRGGDQEAKR
jgi:hypothetical protein